ncbi:MAG: prolyl oligopeptidase family serine peptidase, partial [bacterium]|nr:prolyl oligopeptidase family serine peptidase [bacterium]
MMYKKVIIFVFAIVLASGTALSQEANFQLAEKFYTDDLLEKAGDLTVIPHWLGNSDKFWYSYKTSEGKNFYIVDPAGRSKNLLFDRNVLGAELSKLLNKPMNVNDLPIQNIKFSSDNNVFTFDAEEKKFSYNFRNKTLTMTGDKKTQVPRAGWKNFSPDSSWVVYAKNHNLYLMRSNDADSTEIELATDGERWNSYSMNNGDESKDTKVRARAFWFRDSKKLYVLRSDERKVGDSYVINALSQPRPTLETYKDPLVGEKYIPQPELLVFDVGSRQKVTIDTKKWIDQVIGGWFGFGGMGVGTGSDKIWFMRMDRTWKKVEFCIADTETGESRVLISELSEPYFNAQYAHFDILNDGEEIIWWSERDGMGHLYLYDGEGNLINRITSGPYIVGNISKIDTTGRTLFIEAYGKEEGVDPYFNMYYKIGFDGSGMKLLTPEDASHSFNMSASHDYFVDTYSKVNMTPVSVLRNAGGDVILELEKYDMTWLSEMGYKFPEPFILKAADGVTDIYGVMWKPFDFDPEKKYPIISYVYPGPQTEPVPKTFLTKGSRYGNLPLAQVGFIVMAAGQRGGSPQRSKYYHNYGYENLRDYGLADNKAAIEQLANRHNYIDISKVGIFGHSGGGFMSTAAMLVYPDFYKAAVSSAGNHDNNIYNYVWSELHHGVKEVTKKKDKDGNEIEETVFEAKVPTNQELAKNLKGHLLLVHGDNDNNVNPAHTIRVADELIKAGKRFDL